MYNRYSCLLHVISITHFQYKIELENVKHDLLLIRFEPHRRYELNPIYHSGEYK